MKISTNWIKDYVELDGLDLKEVADKVTNCGVNVECVSCSEKINNLVVGKVLSCEIIPETHLKKCEVDIKEEILNIVCGASNVKSGIKVIVAKSGALLPGDFEIKKRNIRGFESNGMICALSELGMKDVYENGIHILDEEAVIGEDPYKYLNVNSDTIYTLDLNPNRSDCLSHLGFAYEVATVLDERIEMPEIHYKESEEDIKNSYELSVETEKCPLFILKLIKDVEIKESPSFIKERLEAAGMRSINNVVDISNYIMLEYGQPLHYYDADKIKNVLGVRMAHNNEEVVTLDNKKRILSSEDIVITDGEKAIGVAGVMGGFDTEVTENTKNILVEAAIFDPLSIRKTYLKLDLRSEASIRFEKGLNFEYTYEAISRSCHLLEKYANGKPTKNVLIHDRVDKTPKKASVTLEKINKVLGLSLTSNEIKNIFDRLGYEYSGEFEVTIPNRCMDVSIKEDLIEEVGRIYGYDKIVGKLPIQASKKGGYSPKIKYRKDISKRLRSLGLNEVKTYTLVSENDANVFNYENKIIKLERPISKVRTHLRSSLIPSLLEVVKFNEARGVKDINIYELSNVYIKKDEEYVESLKLSFLVKGKYIGSEWNNSIIKGDFYTLKGILENLLHYLGFDKRIKYTTENILSFMHPGISANVLIDNEVVGFLGKLHPNVSKEELYICELNIDLLFNKKSKKIKYEEPSKYPSVNRDLAFLFDKDIVIGEVLEEINKISGKILKKLEIFDIFVREDKKSIAFSLEFVDKTKTLVEEEINSIIDKIIENISKKYNAILRDK